MLESSKNARAVSYGLAAAVIIFWSVTFVSTKTLLLYLTPTDILFCRVVIACALFVAAKPALLVPGRWSEEVLYMAAGVLGTTVYFLGENFALRFGTASNVALIVSISPMLTGVVAHFFSEGERFTKNFAVGSFFCLAGVVLIVCNGHFILKLNPLGDLLAFCAALSFAFYSVLVRRISGRVDMTMLTGKSFLYALISLLPFCFTPLIGCKAADLMRPVVFGNLLFLGAIASAAGYLAWNKVIKDLGAVRANDLLFLCPPLVMVNAAVLLHERITLFAVGGALLILIGVYIAQKN